MTRSAGVIAVLALCLGLAGCGSGSGTVEAAHASTLHEHLATGLSALDRGDEAAALEAVADFRAAVRRLTDDGDLNPDDAQVLLKRADRITADIERQEAAAADAEAAADAKAADDAEAALRELLGESADDDREEQGKGKKGKGKGDDD